MIFPYKDESTVPKFAFDYLAALKDNNNRVWFEEHRQDYVAAQVQIEQFTEGLLSLLQAQDVIETPTGKKALYRIFRDTRFSKDKTPYKTNWGGHFKRAEKFRRGGYYFHLEPGNSHLIGGFFGPSGSDLKLIRKDIAYDDGRLNEILNQPDFQQHFGKLQGEQLKVVPRGFDLTHPSAELLRLKQFLLVRQFSDEEVLSPGFLVEAAFTYLYMRPFLDYMSEVLSSDSNGSFLLSVFL